MRRLAAYYCLVAKTAFRHSFDVTQDILFALFIVLGGLAWLAKILSPRLASMIPDVSGWQIAAGVLALIILARLLLAPYWIHKEQAAEIKRLRSLYGDTENHGDNSSPLHESMIDFCFEKRAPYEVCIVEHHHVRSIVSIGLKNAGRRSLSNCKVFVEKISPEPPLPGGLPILLVSSDFTLRHDDPERLVEIAYHWDHIDKFRFNAPHGVYAETLLYIDDKEQRTIVIRVEAIGYQRSASFRLWTDSSKSLHLEFISYTT